MQAVRNSIAATLGRPLVLREKIAVRSYLRDNVFADVDNNVDEAPHENSSNATHAAEDEGLTALLKVCRPLCLYTLKGVGTLANTEPD